MEPLVGRSLGRYEIIGYLGAGGMGAVYRARDSQLDREVAVKVLPDVKDDPRRLEHFRREATIVAKLSHPNILEIHDFGFDHELPYAVMELLEGKDLRDRMHGRPLPPDKAVGIATAVAEGLAAAHGRGVVHRDIKPENIFITSSGLVKILDFGIARPGPDPSVEVDGQTHDVTVTNTGAIVGTAGYMAPEQIRGRKVDGRSDIFALGCVLYELLTGRHPFHRTNSVDTLLAIVEDPPPPLVETAPGLPPALAMVVHRCLEKEPDDRFDSARDVAFALRAMSQQGVALPPMRRRLPKRLKHVIPRIAAVVAALGAAALLGARLADFWPSPHSLLPQQKHLAIVPLQSSNGGGEMREFAAGLTEMLAADLARLERQGYGRFWVVPSGDARYMHASSVGDMRRVFNPSVVLIGELERVGSKVGLDLAVIDPSNEHIIRSRAIEADFGNVSSFQLDPVFGVTAMLDLDVEQADHDSLAGRTTNVAPAFEAYVRALGILNTIFDEGSTDRSIEMLEDAVKRDPLYDPARETLARSYLRKYQETGDDGWRDRAQAELLEITRSRPSEPAYRILGELYSMTGRPREAVKAFNRALEIAPHSSWTLFSLGRAFERLGEYAEAENVYQRAINIRPGYWPGPNRLATLYYIQGRYEAAANAWRRVTEDAPLCDQGYNNLGAVYSRLGLVDEAQTVFEKSIEVQPVGNYVAYSNLGTMYEQEARFADAAAMYEKALEIEDDDYQVWGNLGYARSFGAEPETAGEPFARAIELAEKVRVSEPENTDLLVRLAGYYWMLDERDTCSALLSEAIALKPREPYVLASIGELYEDLGDRDTALMWIKRSLAAGTRPQFFDQRPLLRDLVADERYQELVNNIQASPVAEGDPS